MGSFPCLARTVSPSGQIRYSLGERLADRYLEFVAGRCRPNTLRAVAFDLKSFFTLVAKDPVDVTAADVFDFLADQRGDRTVVRLADRESGLSARTIARRLSSVSGLYAYLVARGDTPMAVNPVPRGLMTRRQGGSVRSRTAPLVRVPRTLPRILSPAEADRLVAALRTDRHRAMVPLGRSPQRAASSARDASTSSRSCRATRSGRSRKVCSGHVTQRPWPE
jgi:integrase/recombinase XerD